MASSAQAAVRTPSSTAWLGVTAGVLTVLALVEVVVRGGSAPDIEPMLVLAVLATAPVALARGAGATPVALVIAGVTFAILGQHRPFPVSAIAAMVLTSYLVGRRRTVAEAGLVVAPYLTLAITQPWQDSLAARLAAVGLLAAALGGTTLGRTVRSRSQRELHRATEQALAETRSDNAARGERARIARELHDVVAHHISMISVQAETARLTVPGLPDEGARQLTAISETARTALGEMRRLLGVLRDDSGSTVELAPQPGLAQLGELIDEAQAAAGAPVRLVVRGVVAPLDPGIELTVYRVIQEALTNARRHAPGAAVDVELDYRAESLRVQVRDTGPGPSPEARDGHGVLGMRERVAMVGGVLTVGAASGGGYQVTATLPSGGAG